MAFRRVRLLSKMLSLRTVGSIAHRHRTHPTTARDAPDGDAPDDDEVVAADDDGERPSPPLASASQPG